MPVQHEVPHRSLHVQEDSDEHVLYRPSLNEDAARTQKRPKKRKRSPSVDNGVAELPKSAQMEVPHHSLHAQAYSDEHVLSKPPLDDAVVHIGWVLQQEDGSFILEKGIGRSVHGSPAQNLGATTTKS